MPPFLISGDVRNFDPSELCLALREAQITRIDTAARYQNGESEKIIGSAKLAEHFAIDTKINTQAPTDGTLSPTAIDTSLNHSLQVLGVDSVNVLYCHAPDRSTPIAVQAKAFDDHYRQGKFKFLGVSNFDVEMLREWLDVAEREGYVKPSVFQGQYNLLCRAYEDNGLFDLLREREIAFAAFSPLAGGFLLGKYTTEGFSEGSRFAGPGPFRRWYDHESMHVAVRKLISIAEREGLRLSELCLRWLRHHSALRHDDVIILGASRVEQIVPSVRSIEKGPMGESVARELNDLWEGVREDGMSIVRY